ncbi:NAD(P)-dependent oxidoreductase [Actinospica sp.]|uniref:NAD(P)-dependent oxidoreductase n=1 Tax=Actinospica sp. TaxID=1872142 RepID=UPI002B5B6F9C|nr:NAD(P)-dependent oxidoreductase [Actinospica sp.]HWG22754.1 NAD(P)-dependent oxidoreductase [Actinospica sp.]
MSTIGFIGLGAMGSRIAGRLLDAGHEVHGTNRTPAKAEALIERGMHWHDTARQVARAAEITFSMITDDDALRDVMKGPDGLFAGLSAGHVHIDMSTVSPQLSREYAERARAIGAELIEAPVSGSIPAAEDGSLVIMAAGDEATFHRVEPLLRELGSTVTYVGANGQALLLKLAVNISLGAQILALSEGVLLAERGGIDRKLAVDVITGSAVGSPAVRARGPLVLDLPDQAWFDVSLMQKDIRLALDAGIVLNAALPSTALLDRTLTQARALGYAHRDIASFFQTLARSDARPGEDRDDA